MNNLKINAGLNLIKQFCSIAYPLITIPYVTRILGAGNYGKFNFTQSIVSYFIMIAGLGISNYAIREGAKIRDKKEEFEKFSNEVFSINVVSMIISLLLLFTVCIISSKLKSYSLLIAVQSLSIILITLGADWINSIYEDYAYITIRYIIIHIISLVCTFLFVRHNEDYVLYALISVLAAYGGNTVNCIYIRKYCNLRFTIHFNLKRHYKPILYLFCSAITTTIYVSSDTTMIGYFLDDTECGLYGIAAKIYAVVKQLLAAIIVVTLPRLSHLIENKESCDFERIANIIFNILISLTFPLILGLLLMSNDALLLAGGHEFYAASGVLKILSFTLIPSTFASFFYLCILLPAKMEKQCLYVSMISALVNVILNLFLIPIFGIKAAALTTLSSELIVCVAYLCFSKKHIKIYIDKRNLIATIIGCFGIGLIIINARKMTLSYYLSLCIVGLSCLLLYGIVHVLLSTISFSALIRKKQMNKDLK